MVDGLVGHGKVHVLYESGAKKYKGADDRVVSRPTSDKGHTITAPNMFEGVRLQAGDTAPSRA